MRTYGFGGSAPGARARAGRGLVPRQRCGPGRDVGWYLAALPAKARRDRWPSCTARRSVRRCARRSPLVVTSTTSRCCGTRTRSTAGHASTRRPVLPRVARGGARLIAVVGVHGRELLEVLDVPEDEGARDPNAVGEPFRGGRAAEGDYVSRSRPRAAQGPPAPGRGRARASERLPLLVGGRCGLGRRAGRRAEACAGSARSATRSWRGSTAARAASRIALRGSVAAEATRAVVAARTGRSRRSPATRRARRPARPDAIASGSQRRRRDGRERPSRRPGAFDRHDVARDLAERSSGPRH